MPLYIELLHGRDDPNEEMTERGEDGPIIGPLDAFHSTYDLGPRLERKGERGWLLKREDMIEFNGMWYGEFRITPTSPPSRGSGRRWALTLDQALKHMACAPGQCRLDDSGRCADCGAGW